MIRGREMAIEHLSLLHVAPPEFVSVASSAGFDSVGVRVFHPEAAWNPWPMLGSSSMLNETAQRAEDTGVSILGIELLALRPGLVPSHYELVFEAGARLRARYLNVLGEDTDLHRAADTFAALVEAAADYGLRPVLEPIFHKQVRTLAEAVEIVGDSGGGLQIDVLHFHRSMSSLADLRALDSGLLGYLQMDDAPAVAPDTIEGRRAESRSNRLLPGEGELSIAPLLAAMPPRCAVALEVPVTSESEDPVHFARRGLTAMSEFVEAAENGAAATPSDPDRNEAST